MLKKEIKEDLNEWKDMICIKWKTRQILCKFKCRFSAIPTKIPARFFVSIDKFILKFIQNNKRTRIAETILQKKKRIKWEESLYPILRPIPYGRSNRDSVVLAGQTHRSKEQDRKPRNRPTQISPVIFDKGGKAIQWRKDSLYNKWCWGIWTSIGQK